ncbi:forkhead box protein G1-like [Corticium candelabrum]|uniref:forkhead box protein G1-like n=1 Tax=Corticium candelabrum TaxID=121492 RepID=UPI002E3280EC|nr:forkhead box protein G1-like [Corticium candelabrum]
MDVDQWTVDEEEQKEEVRGSRPKITFMNMIASAIFSSPQKKLSLQEIYHFIVEHYGHFYHFENRKAWQNAVRHNLSLHECFVKIRRPARVLSGGKVYETTAHGCYWALDDMALQEFEVHGKIRRRPSARVAKMKTVYELDTTSKKKGRPAYSTTFRDPHLPLPIARPISFPQSSFPQSSYPSSEDMAMLGISPPESPGQSETFHVGGLEQLQEVCWQRGAYPPSTSFCSSSQEIKRLCLEVVHMYDTFTQ